MTRLLLAIGMTAIFALSASAQDAQKQNDPKFKQGAQGQKSSGQPTKSSPNLPSQGASQPPNKTLTSPPAKSVQTRPSVPKNDPPPQRTIVLKPLPSVTFQRSYGYSQQRHSFCQRKAWELHQYELHAAADGYISRRERAIISELKDELEDRCGGFRWRG